MMKKLCRRTGFALVEMILAVSIMAVLAGVGFAAEGAFARNMTKLEYDSFAKEIFVAAQNHLAMAASQNYLGMSQKDESKDAFGNYQFGNSEKDFPEAVKKAGAWFFYCSPSSSYPGTVLNVILPQYAIDEGVRTKGYFIIRYHPDSVQVLDVFYWENTGKRFSYDYTDNYTSNVFNDYIRLLETVETGASAESLKSALKNYGMSHSVIGYYGASGGALSGGADAGDLTRGKELTAPSIVVNNGDKLTVTVTNPNVGPESTSQCTLIVTGLTSGISHPVPVHFDPGSNTAEIILDDITTPGNHFSELFLDLIPGENISIQAVVFSNSELTNVAYSSSQTTNSLFGDDTDTANGEAEISNIRHLENLSTAVSYVNTVTEPDKIVTISKADQTTDLDWDDFSGEDGIYYKDESDNNTKTKDGTFLPVTPKYPLDYDGGGHTVSDIKVDNLGNGGLFGDVEGGSIEDLKLVDFQIESDGNAGALVGTATGTTITNVVAVNTKDKDNPNTPNIHGDGSTGGLIGSATDCTVTDSGASVIVSSGGNAGGLIGTATDTDISSSYSGGHTNNGTYSTEDYNVTGVGDVGGLVGSTSGGTIKDSYSTSSVQTTTNGESVGGLVGSASDTEISTSYATGLVDSSNTSNAGAVAGSAGDGVTFTDCTYYEIVNEKPVGGNPDNGFEPLPPVGGGSDITITPFDNTLDSYNTFVGNPADSENDAVPYDFRLDDNNYPYKKVTPTGPSDEGDPPFVSTHYGDWPSGETEVENTET